MDGGVLAGEHRVWKKADTRPGPERFVDVVDGDVINTQKHCLPLVVKPLDESTDDLIADPQVGIVQPDKTHPLVVLWRCLAHVCWAIIDRLIRLCRTKSRSGSETLGQNSV